MIVLSATCSLIFLLFILGKPTIFGFVIYASSTVLPTQAVSQAGANQISPNGGTVDISDNTYVTLTYGTDAYVTVSQWNTNLPINSTVSAVNLTCEIDLVGGRGENLVFGYNTTGTGWNYACNQTATAAGTYWCNLFAQGIDTPSEFNALDTRCQVEDNNGATAAYVRLDAIKMTVNSSVVRTSGNGTVRLHVDSTITLTLTDDSIDFGFLGLNDNISSEDIKDWFNITNDGSIDFDVFAYGVASPFSTTTNGANTLPNNFYFVHANSSKTGIVNTNYVPVPANVTTKVLLIDGLQNTDGLDTAALGIRAIVPSDEGAGPKSAQLVIFVEPN